MFRDSFQDDIGMHLVVENHETPICRFSLRANESADLHLAPPFQNFKQDLDLSVAKNGVEQKVIQN